MHRFTPHDYRDALRKGLGRALQKTLRTGRLLDEQATVDACLRNLAYDPQVEGSRADWLIEILDAAGAAPRILEPVLTEALERSSQTWDLDQLCDLACVLAARGSASARQALYGVLDRRPDARAPWIGQTQIVRLDGVEGFIRVARRRGASLRAGLEDWDSELEFLAAEAEELCGAEPLAQGLQRAAQGDPDVRAFREQLAAHRPSDPANRNPAQAHADRMRSIPATEVLRQIAEDAPASNRFWYVGWGLHAESEDLGSVQAAMLEERHPGRLLKYLSVLTRCALPRFDPRVIEYADHADLEVRHCARQMLQVNTHAAIREYALDRLNGGSVEPSILGLLTRNYCPGDERWIEVLLTPRTRPEEAHALVWAILDIYEANRVAEGRRSILFAYEETPCSSCRGRAVRFLEQQGLTPEPLLEECRLDASKEIRAAVSTER